MEQQNNWVLFWNRNMPGLAIAGPLSFFIASLFVAAHIGIIPDKTYVISNYEGFIMVLGTPFMAATFIYLGQVLSTQFFRFSILVTVLGILGVVNLGFISGMRILQQAYVDSGFDSNTVWAAWDNASAWHIPLYMQNVAGLLANVLGGIGLMRMKVIPTWIGLALALCIPATAVGQMIGKTEIFWPLGTALWTIAIWGLVKSKKKASSESIYKGSLYTDPAPVQLLK